MPVALRSKSAANSLKGRSITWQNIKTSTISMRRSAEKHLDTYDCGLPSFCATCSCVSPEAFCALLSIRKNKA